MKENELSFGKTQNIGLKNNYISKLLVIGENTILVYNSQI